MGIELEEYTEEEFFEYNIWELKLKIDVAETHIDNFKEDNKNFKNQEKRVKGTDTVFYEINLPEWTRMLDISLNQFKKDYGREYDKTRVRFQQSGT